MQFTTGLLFLFSSRASLAGSVCERAACNADNCLRAVRQTQLDLVTASSFCHISWFCFTMDLDLALDNVFNNVSVLEKKLGYLSLSTQITNVVTATATASTAVSSIISSTTTILSTVIVTSTAPTSTITTGTTTVDNGYVCTVTVTPTQYAKRAAPTPFSDLVSSACSTLSATLQQQRISSACSCFLGTGTSKTTSTVLQTSTITLKATSNAVSTQTSTTTSTVVISQTISTTVTVSTGYLSTATVSSCTSTVTATTPAVTATACSQIPNPYTANGKSYNIECNNYYLISYATNQGKMSFHSCLELCAASADCVAADDNGVTCWTFTAAQFANEGGVGGGSSFSIPGIGINRATLQSYE